MSFSIPFTFTLFVFTLKWASRRQHFEGFFIFFILKSNQLPYVLWSDHLVHWQFKVIVDRYALFAGLSWWLRWWRILLHCRRPGFDPWVGKIPWGRQCLPTPVFSRGECQEQRSMVGCITVHGVIKSRTRLSNWTIATIILTIYWLSSWNYPFPIGPYHFSI